MVKQFLFADFINEFKTEFLLHEKQEVSGYYNDDGDWVPPKTKDVPTKKYGIILPLSEDDLKYAENGVYTTKEKKLYTTFPVEEGSKITYKNDDYTVQSFKDYSDYADVYIYIMRWREQ